MISSQHSQPIVPLSCYNQQSSNIEVIYMHQLIFTFFVKAYFSVYIIMYFLYPIYVSCQIISNEEYKSVEHRVLANSKHEARTSVSIFFNPSQRENLYGPLPELISAEKPALYRQFTYSDFMRRFFTKELDGKSLINFYRL